MSLMDIKLFFTELISMIFIIIMLINSDVKAEPIVYTNTEAISSIGSDAQDFILLNRGIMIKTAIHYRVSATAIAAVIAGEWTLNRNYFDSIQDKWLRTRLETYNISWWETWLKDSSESAEYLSPVEKLIGQWPVALISSGFITSFGPAQIQPRTIISACKKFPAEPICHQNTKSLMASLLDDHNSIQLAAIILRYEADIWILHMGYDPTNDIGLMATLYSRGAKAHIASIKTEDHLFLNPFGQWASNNRTGIESLLSKKPDKQVRQPI